jgi:hypothetical protein
MKNNLIPLLYEEQKKIFGTKGEKLDKKSTKTAYCTNMGKIQNIFTFKAYFMELKPVQPLHIHKINSNFIHI